MYTDIEKELVGIDYETTGFEAYGKDRIFSFSITRNNKDIHTTVHRFDWAAKSKRIISKALFNKYHTDKYIKIAHNAKFEMGFTAMYYDGVLPKSEWHDTMIMSQLLRNLIKNHSLDVLSDIYFSELYPEEATRWKEYDNLVSLHKTKQKRLFNNYPDRVHGEILEPMFDAGIQPFVIDRPNYGLVPVDIMDIYQESDGDRCMLLFMYLWKQIKGIPALLADYINEMKLIYASQKMEQFGMMVHVNNAIAIRDDLQKKIDKLIIEKKKIFGFDINIDSPDQLQKHLYGYIDRKKHEKKKNEKRLAVWKLIKPRFAMEAQMHTPSGAPSASKDALIALQKKYPNNQALDVVLRWRAFSKGKTIIESYLDLRTDDNIVHPNIQTNEAKTGRQSIRKPSLQNTAKEFSIKSEYTIPARRCFRPRPGYVYFMGDYAGIEMRMIINASGEDVLINKLKEDIDYDVHTFNAEIMLQDEWFDMVATGNKQNIKGMRAGIKDVGFAIPYGAGLPKLSLSLKKPIIEVREILKRYSRVCPNIVEFNNRKKKEVITNGYITTVFGRRLYIYKEKSYIAANYQIQGDAAGTLKRAQVNIADYLKTVWDDEIKQVIPVHDEIIIEYPRKYLPMARQVLHDLNWCMINIPEIKVPLMTEWKMSTINWQDTIEFKL